MSSHHSSHIIVTYDEAENRSVVGKRKKESEDRPQKHGEVAWLCSVDSSGMWSFYNSPSATALGHRLSAMSPAESHFSLRKWDILTCCMLLRKKMYLKLSMTNRSLD